MTEQTKIEQFAAQLADVQILAPRDVKKGKIAQAIYTRQIVTVVGVKTTTGRFLPVSHPGYSNETYVDKVDLLGKTRAEFIGRKLKGIERRAHMALFRELVEANTEPQNDWRTFFAENFGKECTVPEGLCVACWNCSLFGGMEAGRGATFSRLRYFDTFSVEDAAECIQSDESPEQMAIGNTVGEDLSEERSGASFHRYEYVKAGVRFPFIAIIESPTLLDVAGYLTAVNLADQHGYGKYSASHGKFDTEFLAVSTGYPLFSVLNMLGWLENSEASTLQEKLHFEAAVSTPVSLFGADIAALQKTLPEQFRTYLKALNTASATSSSEEKPKRTPRAKK